jgi:hypothetical protein
MFERASGQPRDVAAFLQADPGPPWHGVPSSVACEREDARTDRPPAPPPASGAALDRWPDPREMAGRGGLAGASFPAPMGTARTVISRRFAPGLHRSSPRDQGRLGHAPACSRGSRFCGQRLPYDGEPEFCPRDRCRRPMGGPSQRYQVAAIRRSVVL